MIRSRRFVLFVCSLVALLGVVLWRLSERWPHRVKVANGAVILLQNAPDGGFYAVSQNAKTSGVTLWKLRADLSVTSSCAWKHPVRQAVLSTDGRILALAEWVNGWQSVVRFYDTRDGRLMKTPEMTTIANMAFSPDGRYFVFCKSDPYHYGNNWTVFRRQGEKLILENRPKLNVSAWQLSFSADSKTLAVGGMGGDIAVVDFPSLKPRAVSRFFHDDGKSNSALTMTLSPNQKKILLLTPNSLWSWDIYTQAKKKLPLVVPRSVDYNSQLLFSPDGARWVLDATQVWNVKQNHIERTLPSKTNFVIEIFAPNGDLLVGDTSGTITRWKLK